MSRVYLLLLIHSHQPVGNFDHVLEQAYRKSYLPFLEVLERHAQIRVSLHYTGGLLEWLAGAHPEFLERLGRAVKRGQVELIGGGFYEPIFPVIPEEDRRRQIRLLSDFLLERFGVRPRGMWLAERVWEPTLPATLAEAGIEYTLVDDSHFLAAGLEPEELYGYYLSEDLARPLRIIPGLKKLRYFIPFHQVTEVLDFLRSVGQGRDVALAAMGDDCEKFGSWPGTYEHCYTNHWLDDLFTAIDRNSDWLETTAAAHYLDAQPPLGRVYLPTASYSEMMEWALPTGAQEQFERARLAIERGATPSEIARFFRGGFWRNFLSKYSESNHLHKRMLDVSARLDELEGVARPEKQKRLEEARRHLLRVQCNDAYWHGVFGGLYAPHLRTALYRNLIQAEAIAAAIDSSGTRPLSARVKDFDVDGVPEFLFAGPNFQVIVDPGDGGTVSEIDLLSCGANLINSLMRRREPYHQKIIEAAQAAPAEGVKTIHESQGTKEVGLEKLLRYDRYERSCFRALLFPHWKSFADFTALELEENAELASALFDVALGAEPGVGSEHRRRVTSAEDVPQDFLRGIELGALSGVSLSRHVRIGEGAEIDFGKGFSLRPTKSNGVEIRCLLRMTSRSEDALDFALGIELVANLLAPDAPDRYFELDGRRQRLRWSGEVPGRSRVRVVDEWQHVRIELTARQADAWWIAPIETVSQSEAGSERVYQGSSLLAVWRIELAPKASWEAELTYTAEPLA